MLIIRIQLRDIGDGNCRASDGGDGGKVLHWPINGKESGESMGRRVSVELEEGGYRELCLYVPGYRNGTFDARRVVQLLRQLGPVLLVP